MLGQRRRLWPNIVPALGECFHVCHEVIVHLLDLTCLYFVTHTGTLMLVPRGALSLPMLSRFSILGIARAAPPCTSGSANDRRRTRVIINACTDVSTPTTIDDISPNSAEQSANIFGEVHQGSKHPRYIGDTSAMFSTCLCGHWRYILNVMISPMVS